MRCSSPLTPAPCPGSPGQHQAPPSSLPSWSWAGQPGVGVGQGRGGLAVGGTSSWGSPARRQPVLGREGSPWRAVGWGSSPQSHLWAVSGGGESKPGGGGRGEEGLRAPSICQQPPAPRLGARPHQPGCLLPAGLPDAVRGKSTGPLSFPFPLFVVSWRAIGCRL